MHFYKIFILILMIFWCSGCEKAEITEKDLEKDYNKINEYYLENETDENFVFTYIDLSNKKVVVGLEENTLDAQNKFKENVIDSKNVVFVSVKNYKDKNDYEEQKLENVTKCLNNILGAYISNENTLLKEELISNLIDTSNYDIEYSKVYKANNYMYIIIKSDNFIDNPLEQYFSKEYKNYSGIVTNGYYIYLYNGEVVNNLQEELNKCFQLKTTNW
ncbi:MAG: hypothetical protein ACLUFU_04065 [Bacilli bacterium]